MDLFRIIAGYVAAINPMVPVTLRTSAGYTTNADFSRTPSYITTALLGQVQALSFRDIQQLDGLNLNGSRKAIYLQGDVEGLVRVAGKGGDLITFPDGTVWLVATVLESWLNNLGNPAQGWVKVAVTEQNGS